MSAISKATEQVGSIAILASQLGLKHQIVWSWVKQRHQVPAKYILAVSNATGGKVSIQELLSDHCKENHAA